MMQLITNAIPENAQRQPYNLVERRVAAGNKLNGLQQAVPKLFHEAHS